MEHDVDEDVAINLSTSQRPSAATTPNGSVEPEDVELVRLFSFESNLSNYRKSGGDICIRVQF